MDLTRAEQSSTPQMPALGTPEFQQYLELQAQRATDEALGLRLVRLAILSAAIAMPFVGAMIAIHFWQRHGLPWALLSAPAFFCLFLAVSIKLFRLAITGRMARRELR